MTNKVRNTFENIAEYLYTTVYSFLLFPAVLKFGNLFFVDLRYQSVVPGAENSVTSVLFAAGLSLLEVIAGREFAKRGGVGLKSCCTANIPLAGCGIMWFFAPSFELLLLNIVFVALSCGRVVAISKIKEFKELEQSKAWLILATAVILFAAVGTYQQYDSYNRLAMSWFDWGHFYECLNNFFRGKPFHLNLCDGSFLGSRFTPTLTLLLPVVAARSVVLFFFTGSLLVCSGAIFVYLLARAWKMSVNEALMWSIWYLFLPVVANMNLSLREGFHEVFMLFPLIPAAVWCAVTKKYASSAVLILLILGVRETTGIIVAGYGVLLFANKEKKAGILLFASGVLYVIAVFKIFMPLFDPPVEGTYAHVGFYSHLGSSVAEIALSPFTKPAAFWGAFFNIHTLLFWCTLFLPFAVLVYKRIWWLVPAIPEFVMVSVDRRFDSQTVLRHYQISIIMVLVIAALYGAKCLKKDPRPNVLFCGLHGTESYRGTVAVIMAATVLSFIFFVRYPGFPASDPQRRYLNNGNITRLENARETVARIKKLIPAGAKVTAGPMLATHLVPDYDIYFKFAPDDKTLEEYVLLENFSSFYFPEDRLSRYLLTSPNWQLIHQEFIDERSVQLFKKLSAPAAKRSPLFKLPENVWQKAGQPIPLPVTDFEMRAAPAANNCLQIGVRIKAKRKNDAGFKTLINFADGTQLTHFTSFGNGRYPADLAEVGEAFFYLIKIPENRRITSCRFDIVEITGKTTPL